MKDLGDRMKDYESFETGRKFMPLLPICARIDGKCFNSFTRELDRPYDVDMITLMQEVTKNLVENTCADIGYTQSDEITLIWKNDKPNSEMFFNRKIFKLTSVLASMTTAFFNDKATETLGNKINQIAFFDCRVWQVPNLTEATNLLLWREQDATKNSVSMLAREYFSHKQLYKKSSSQMQNMLFSEFSVNWNDCPSAFKRGTYIKRQKITRSLSKNELDDLPPMHNARKNPETCFTRHIIDIIDIPPINSIQNRVRVFFDI